MAQDINSIFSMYLFVIVDKVNSFAMTVSRHLLKESGKIHLDVDKSKDPCQAIFRNDKDVFKFT